MSVCNSCDTGFDGAVYSMSAKEREITEQRLDYALVTTLRDLLRVCKPLELKNTSPDLLAEAKRLHRLAVLADRKIDGKDTLKLLRRKFFSLVNGVEHEYPDEGEEELGDA
jgi:hypothetical protein